MRAAYGKQQNQKTAHFKKRKMNEDQIFNKYPWGSQAPQPGIHGNFGLFSWAPTPVGYFPKGKTEFGLYDMVIFPSFFFFVICFFFDLTSL